MCLLKKIKGDGSFHVYVIPGGSENSWLGGGIDFTSLQDAQKFQRRNLSYEQYAITWKRKGSPGWVLVERNR